MKIIVLSDINGWSDISLEFTSDITRLDSRKLGDVIDNEKKHEQFINVGIDRAVAKVKNYHADLVIGLSIGGTIAWKAALEGWACKHFILISSTRIRLESSKPSSDIFMVFGELDAYKPRKEWFAEMMLPFEIIPSVHHDLYTNETLTSKILAQYLEKHALS